jgi:hypothetical protein
VANSLCCCLAVTLSALLSHFRAQVPPFPGGFCALPVPVSVLVSWKQLTSAAGGEELVQLLYATGVNKATVRAMIDSLPSAEVLLPPLSMCVVV